MEVKTCTKCGKEKPLDSFHKNDRSADGRRPDCKTCRLAKVKKWADDNRENKRRKDKEYRLAHADEINVRVRVRRSEAPEHFRKLGRESYQRNKEKDKRRSKEWKKKNRDRVNERTRKLRSTPEGKMRHALSNRIRQALTNNHKSQSSMELLGCTIEQLRAHLEALWQEGMSWDNYGKKGWHIDHIRPLASFDLTDPAQQREAFHYSNCKPEWESDNTSKGSLWEGKRWKHGDAAGVSESGEGCQD